MRTYKTLKQRKYYKLTSWTQPTLTSNGTFGGSEMGVEVNWYGGTGFSGTAYTIFEPNNGNIYMDGDMFRTTLYLNIYLPQPTILTSFKFGNYYVTDASSGCYYSTLWGGSSKNNRATSLAYLESLGEGGTYTFDLSSNLYRPSRAFQHYTFETSTWGTPYEDTMWFGKILMTGYILQESTSSDYTFYKDINTYKLIKKENQNKYYALKSFEKGKQYYGN